MSRLRSRPAALALVAAACGAASGAVAEGLRLDPDFDSARVALEPVRWLFAQATPSTPAAPAAARQAGPETRGSPSWAARIFPFIGSGDPVGFAPPRWGGTVSLEYLGQSGEEGLRRHVASSAVSLNVASYFWQPWFAQVRGTATLLGSLQRGTQSSAFGEPRDSTGSLSVSGGGSVTVFPGSRFPFLASLDSTDSRASGEFTTGDYRNTRASLRQSWRDPLGATTVLGSLDYSRLDSASYGRDSVLQLDSRYLGTHDPHRLDAALTWSRNRQSLGGEGTELLRAFGTHLYTPSPDLWVNTLASVSQTDLGGFGGGSGFTQQLGQVSSQAVWRPESDERLALTGGGRVFVNRLSLSGPDSTAHSIAANAGATYSLTEQTTLQASASVTRVAAGGGEDALVRFGSAGANYVSRPIDLGPASYSFSASAQAGHQAGGADEARTASGVQGDHQLSRSVAIGEAVTLNLLATQGAGITRDSLIGRTTTIRAGASAGLRVVATEASDAYFGASYGQSDSRGGVEDRFRLANLQASGQVRFGQWDSLSANVTAQWVRSRRDVLAAEEDSRQVYGGISYQHSRVFGLPRLRYLLSATFNEGILGSSRLLGDVDAPRENVTQLVDQRLVYDIGRLELRVGTRLAKVDGRDDLQWYLRIHRQIGQY